MNTTDDARRVKEFFGARVDDLVWPLLLADPALTQADRMALRRSFAELFDGLMAPPAELLAMTAEELRAEWESDYMPMVLDVLARRAGLAAS